MRMLNEMFNQLYNTRVSMYSDEELEALKQQGTVSKRTETEGNIETTTIMFESTDGSRKFTQSMSQLVPNEKGLWHEQKRGELKKALAAEDYLKAAEIDKQIKSKQ